MTPLGTPLSGALSALLSLPLIALLGCDAGPAGPCSATRLEGDRAPGTECLMQYEADRMVASECLWYYGWQDPETSYPAYRFTVTRTYSGDELLSVNADDWDSGNSHDTAWTFEATRVVERRKGFFHDSLTRFTREAIYERDGFAFAGHPLDPEVWPSAPDALVEIGDRPAGGGSTDPDSRITYDYDGPPRQGLRTRTGSDGSVMTFRYDAHGRLVEVDGQRAYVYDGDRLVEDHLRMATYEYDDVGNLTAKVGMDSWSNRSLLEFNYRCR